MKKILTAIIFLIILSCKPDKKELPAEFANTEEFLIEFLQRKVRLPSEYKRTSIEQMFAIMKSFEKNPDGFVELQFSELRMLQSTGSELEIFADKENFMNTISFMLGEYIPLDKSIVNTYVNMLERRILPQSAKFGLEYKRLETKFISYKKAKIIKVRYQQTIGTNKRFMTQYLITSGLKTFSMVVVNYNDVDFQYVLKNFAL